MSADKYTIGALGPYAVITMPGEIDVTNADRAEEALQAALSQPASVLIIDMTETTFCDSAGVQAIVAAHKHAAAIGKQLRLVAPAVERILTLVGIDQMIPMYPTLEAAQTPGGS
jgi:anti-sigma B factor antagonist